MGERPKSSLAGIAGVLSGFYGVRKLSTLDSNFEAFSNQIVNAVNTQTAVQIAGFTKLIDLQSASLYAIRDVEKGIQRVEKELAKISNNLERIEAREEFVGDLKLIILSIKKALDHIDSIKNDYTPWATLETQILLDLVEEYDLQINHFKRLPPTEIEFVQQVLDRLNLTHSECKMILEGK